MPRPSEEATHLIQTVSTSGEDLSPIMIFSHAATQSCSRIETAVVLRNCFGTWTRVVAMIANSIAACQPQFPHYLSALDLPLNRGLTLSSLWSRSAWKVFRCKIGMIGCTCRSAHHSSGSETYMNEEKRYQVPDMIQRDYII